KQSNYSMFHTGRQSSVFLGDLELGSFGELHPAVLRRLDMPQRIYLAEFSLHDLLQVQQKNEQMQPLPIYPSSDRDWTITLPEGISLEEVLKIIRAQPAALLKKVCLIDIY